MITLDNDTIVLDRTVVGDDILPLNHPSKAGKGGGWYIDLGIEQQDVLHRLIDAEILEEDIAIRYIAQNGQTFDAQAHIVELISGPDGDLCRLQGKGQPPTAFLADEPKII